MYNALESLQAFEAGTAGRKAREKETAMKGIGNALASGDYAGGAAQAFAIDPEYGMRIKQYGDGANALALRKDIGGMIGAGDRAGAAAKAYGAGELEMGANIDAQIAQMTQQQRETALFVSGQLGNAAMTLKGITDPAQRQAEWQQMQGYLTNDLGIDPAALAQFNPMDDNDLTQAMGQAQSFSDRLAGQRWQQTFDQSADAQKFSEMDANRRFGLLQTEAETKAAEAEAKAAAGPEINVDDEATFRREYNSITSGFRDVQSSYGRIKATDATTPAGQLSLVYQYMKMLDPGSTVMQGEQASASNAAGVPDKTRNLYNSIINGKPLSAAQVTDFTNQADRLYARSLQDYDKARTTYEGLATLYGFAPQRTVPDLATGRTAPAVGSDGVPNLLRAPERKVGPSGQLVPDGFE